MRPDPTTARRAPAGTRFRRVWAVGLALWGCALLVARGPQSFVDAIRPARIEFDVRASADDPHTVLATASASGRARTRLDARRVTADGAESRHLVRLHGASRAPDDDVHWASGSELFAAREDGGDLAAGAVLALDPRSAAVWFDDAARRPPHGADVAWRIGGESLSALRAGVLVTAPALDEIGARERLIVMRARDQVDVAATIDRWRSELDACIPAADVERAVVVVATRRDHPALAVRHGARDVLVAVTGDGAAARERFVEALALARLRAGGALEGERAWIDPAIARRIAIALADERTHAARWRDLLAYRVFLASTYERPLRALGGAVDRAYDYTARLKGPQFLRALELAAGHATDGVDVARRWVAVRAAVSDGVAFEDAVERALGPAARAEHARLAGGDTPLGIEPWGRDLVPAAAPRRSAQVAHTWTLAITADTENFLETCGCRLRQAGGIARRARAIAELREVGPVVAVDLGNVTPRVHPEDFDDVAAGELALQLEADRRMGYALHVLGPNELHVGRPAFDAAPRAFHAVNVRSVAAGEETWSRERVTVDVPSGRAVFVPICPTTPYWIDPDEWRRRTHDVVIDDPVEAAVRACADVPTEETLVVAGALPTWRIAELVDAAPGIDVVISWDRRVLRGAPGSRADGDPHRLASGFVGDTLVVLANEESHGLAVVRLDVAIDGRVQRFEQRAHMLTPDHAEDAGIRALLDDYYAGLAPSARGPDSWTPVANEREERALIARVDAGSETRGYVGSDACRACHAEAYADWLATPHASAFRTLEDKHRARSPDCLRCHVVGFGLPSGFSAAASRSEPSLRNVGCEVCHGPGHAHAVERPGDPSLIRRGFDVAQCESCHDAEHSEPLTGRSVDPFDIGAHRPRSAHAPRGGPR